MKSMNKLILATCVATALIPVSALALDAKNQGYLIDSSGSIVMSGTGLCWHTSDWTPARAVEGCDPTNKPLAAAPAYVAPAAVIAAAPTPAPAPIVRPAPMPQKMSFSADALFAFDKAIIKPEGKVMLNDLASQLNGTTYDTIMVTGHADRFGSDAYNQKLSTRRSTAVKDYLVSQNIPASRIDAQGKGETQPVTKADECKGAKSAKVIACLQPDRRVDVEMTGTKPAVAAN
jgi:OOP family OmpA-OmpF porin